MVLELALAGPRTASRHYPKLELKISSPSPCHLRCAWQHGGRSDGSSCEVSILERQSGGRTKGER